MNGRDQARSETTSFTAARAAAAVWVVRLQRPEVGEADWLEFEAWLQTAPGARPAYDAAMALWLLPDGFDADDPDRDRRGHERFGARGKPRFGGMAALGFGGLGAAIAAGLTVISLQSPAPQVSRISRPAATIYTSVRGQQRTVTLADGTRLDLSGGSRVVVSLDAGERHVTMSEGEVAFTVTHDPRRPFSVSVGDREVRDMGTEFDIRRAGSRIKVTVRQGQVEVAATAGRTSASATPIALVAGRQLTHVEGSDISTVRSVSADEVFAWKQGRLIYRDQPLRVVVDDLNRQFPQPLRIEDEHVAALRFTGVLSIDSEDATIRRLVGLLPIAANRINGTTVLKAREDAR